MVFPVQEEYKGELYSFETRLVKQKEFNYVNGIWLNFYVCGIFPLLYLVEPNLFRLSFKDMLRFLIKKVKEERGD